MKIFSGSSNPSLTNEIAKHLNLTVSLVERTVFPDGEQRLRVLDKVVGEDTIIVQPTDTPSDHNYMELFFIADALKRSGAKTVTLVMPYVGYQRQDHVFREGEARSLEVVASMMEKVGVDKLIAFDLHSIKIPELFTIPVVHLSALPLFAKHIEKEGWHTQNSVLASPDMGGIRRIKELSKLLSNMPYAVIQKERDLATGDIISDTLEGEVRSRVIIVDDMISSGKTIVAASDLLIKNGAKEIIVFATHPVFSEHAPKRLEHAAIEKVYVTNSIQIPQEKIFPKLEILSIAGIIAHALKDEL